MDRPTLRANSSGLWWKEGGWGGDLRNWKELELVCIWLLRSFQHLY